MREIGGYLELDNYLGEEYHPPQYALNCGRNALVFLFESRKIRKLYLPYYLCDSVSEVCEKYSIPVEYYHIDRLFFPLFDRTLGEREYLYIVNYYGQITNQQIINWHQKYERLIVDNAQAFFQMPVAGVDTIYSCRKFFGVPDGAYLYTDSIIDRELDTDLSYNRMSFLLGRYEKEASEFYSEYIKNNQVFQNEPLKKMSKLTHNLLRAIDYNQIMKRRTANFRILHKNLSFINDLSLVTPEGAFMYPLLVKNGIEIRKKLLGFKIYIPSLWPNVLITTEADNIERDMASRMLPIPCDQRYFSNDLEYMVSKILDCIE